MEYRYEEFEDYGKFIYRYKEYRNEGFVKIRIVNGRTYFCAADLSFALGSARTTSNWTRDLVNSGILKFAHIPFDTIKPVNALDPDGVKIVLSRTRTNKSKQLSEALEETFPGLGFEQKIIVQSKEDHYISNIVDSLLILMPGLEFTRNKGKNTPYRIDLIITSGDKKFAVECDEQNHRDRDSNAEVRRQAYLERRGYIFFRFDPDSASVGTVIGKLLQFLESSITHPKKKGKKIVEV